FTTANLKHSSFYDSYDSGEITPADESVLSVWTAYYKAINMANNLISNIPLYGDFDPVKEEQYVAEAKFIRAYSYLELLKLFGDGALTGQMNGFGLPLQLTPFKGYNTGDVIARSTNGDVFSQFILDLQESLAALPDKHSTDLKTRSRATKGSAN